MQSKIKGISSLLPTPLPRLNQLYSELSPRRTLPRFPPTQTRLRETPGGPQHYRQPACGYTSHNLALGSVGSGVEAGAQRRRGRHRLRVKRSVVGGGGGGGRAELGAAKTRRPQLGGVQRGQALCGLRCGRSQGPRRAQHGECGAPYPLGSGARARGTCGLCSRLRRGRREQPPMDARRARPDPPLLARRPALASPEITARRSRGAGGTARGWPGTASVWAPGIALARGSFPGCPRTPRSRVCSDPRRASCAPR